MSSLKTFLFGGLLAGLTATTAVACAGSPVVTDDEDPPAGQDASTTSKDGAPSPSTTARDSSPPPTPSGDSSSPPPGDASTGTDSAVGVDATPPPPPPPPPDASTGLPPACDLSNFLVALKAIAQLDANDTPPCDTTCRGCCYPLPPFCVK